MFAITKKPADILTKVGDYYEVTVLEDIDLEGGEITSIIRGELRGWEYDERVGIATVLIWEIGASKAEEYYEGDIVAVSPIDLPIEPEAMFFEPYKGRPVSIGSIVDVYRNLHTNNGYSIRCSKTGLVLHTVVLFG
ncbi:hypothetical protein FAY30_26990 (plasmid) [Bacillus sp. S3]|uniref:hypothetical protein n=1 Tax=Bacillus sp. S3 TaxID=486398 RepID=UPI001187F172|nr:hypothetical protein [Bacillus sp. S3]QCJ45579.1 hypothetical protein FAY30_26990 [Bacillus sp. S3]